MCIVLSSHCTTRSSNKISSEPQKQKRASYFCKSSKQARSIIKGIKTRIQLTDIKAASTVKMMSFLRHFQTSLRVRQSKKACQLTCSKKAHTGTRILPSIENENAIFYFEVLLVVIQPLRILYVFASI
jgi:hypothetical protein